MGLPVYKYRAYLKKKNNSSTYSQKTSKPPKGYQVALHYKIMITKCKARTKHWHFGNVLPQTNLFNARLLANSVITIGMGPTK